MYTFHSRVAASDVDETSTQTLLSVVTMMQDCSILWLGREHVLRRWLDEENAAMMLASRELELRRRAEVGEELTVSTWIYKVSHRMGWRNTCIFDARGRPVATCWCLGVFVSYDDGHALEIPDDVLSSFVLEEPMEMEYGKRKIVLPDVERETCPAVTVQHSDIDLNGHMNNAQYVRIATDLLPEGSDPRHMRIVHEGQAKLGASIVPVHCEADGVHYFTLGGPQGERYATLEFR